jgi:hypothetical protein
MTSRFLGRFALIFAVAMAPSALVGCGDGGNTTTIPAKTPPIPTDAKGKPVGPPTAAGAAGDAAKPK